MARKTPPTPGAKPGLPGAFDAPGAIDDVCDRIEAGDFLCDIAAHYGVHRSQLTRWAAADPERKRRIDMARTASGESYAEEADLGLKNATTAFDLAKARDRAHHLRWMASKRDPKQFGDRTILAGDRENPITIATVDLTDEQLAAIASGSGE